MHDIAVYFDYVLVTYRPMNNNYASLRLTKECKLQIRVFDKIAAHVTMCLISSLKVHSLLSIIIALIVDSVRTMSVWFVFCRNDKG